MKYMVIGKALSSFFDLGHLGIQLTNMQPDVATLRLPFADSLITIGTTMHGGAIASQVDTQGRQLTEELRAAAQKTPRMASLS